MTVLEVLVFATAVQWCAGVVIMINVVMYRLQYAEAQSGGGE